MKNKKFFLIVFYFTLVSISCNATENIGKFFKIQFKQIEQREIDPKTSEGFILEKLKSDKGDIFFRIDLYSSLGKTVYTCYFQKSDNYWLIEKKAIFYDEPFRSDKYESINTYYKYDKMCYEQENGQFVKKDIGDAEAVIDLENVTVLIDLIRKYYPELN